MINSFSNEIPIFLQLEDELRFQIVSGLLKPNERLLTVRQLALKYKVNPNTIQKALTSLEQQKLIYTESTNGKFVTNDIKLITKIKNDIAKSNTKKYLENMHDIGLTNEEIFKTIKEVK